MTTKPTHTPGPWIYELNEAANNFFVGQPHGPTVALVSSMARGHIEANARLIAAAPDLLAACLELLDLFNSGRIREAAYRESAIVDARAAIARAEGR